MMFRIFARAGSFVAAAAFIAACDTTTRAPEAGNALMPGAPAESTGTAPTGTSGAEAPASGPAAPAAEPAASGAADTPAPAARYREVTIPAGTVLAVRLNTGVGSDTSRPEQRVDGTLARGVRIGGVEAIGAGAALRGIVTDAERSGRVKGLGTVSLRFNQLTSRGQTYAINTRTVSSVAPATKKRDAATIGIPTAGGAIIGGIIGGGDGAVKGGAAGGAAGTAAVLATRGKEVRLAPGSSISVRLASPLTVSVPVR